MAMESYSHEEFITALRMVGKEPIVTPQTLQIREEQRLRTLGIVPTDAARAWERREEQESQAEYEQRMRSKAAARAKLKDADREPFERRERPEEQEQAEDTNSTTEQPTERSRPRSARETRERIEAPPPVAMEPVVEVVPISKVGGGGGRETRERSDSVGLHAAPTPRTAGANTNCVLLVATGGGTPELEQLTERLRRDGNVLRPVDTVPEAIQFLEQDPLAQKNLRVFLRHATTSTVAEAGLLVDATSRITPPPPVVVLLPDSTRAADATALLERYHRPPNVVVTQNPQIVARFLDGSRRDYSELEEGRVRERLVQTAPDEVRAGKVLAVGSEHDLRMPSSRDEVVRVTVGMHWIGRDLDLSCIVLDADGDKIGVVSFLETTFADECFSHSGDMLDAPNGAKEAITVDVTRIPAKVAAMYFVITSYSGETFSQVQTVDASITVQSVAATEPFAQFTLGGSGDHRALILCRVSRTGAKSWAVQNTKITNETAETARLLVKPVQQHYKEHPCVKW